ncbi:hypothetical protein ACHQM5_012307 [Ranunculus cassubicifolius]
MEDHKARCKFDFFRRQPKNSYKIFFENLQKSEESARAYYGDPIGYSSDKFVEIMLCDGIFILELFFKYWESEPDVVGRDILFRNLTMLPSLRFDMLLLENQLPYFVLERIFNLFTGRSKNFKNASLLQLTLHFFSFKSYLTMAEDAPRTKAKVDTTKHFLDLLRECCLPSTGSVGANTKPEGDDKTLPTATELHKAGVKFIKVTGNINFFLTLTFSAKGEFRIPLLTVHGRTDIIFRNLVAYEQCFKTSREQYITLYLHLMDSLIDTPNDVTILRRYGIIDNVVADNEHVSNIFNNISKGTAINPDMYFYQEIVKNVNNYCNTPWNSFKAILFREYFYSPWAIASSIAVIVVIVCTIIQAVCSVVSILP